jgi:hypothetical protein
LGVVGEWRYGGQLEDAHNAIHEHDLKKIAEAQQLAGDAKDSARDAKESAIAADKAAGKAQLKADAAGTSAKRANDLVSDTESELQDVKKDAIQLRDSVDESSLRLAANAGGYTFRPELYDALKKVNVFNVEVDSISQDRYAQAFDLSLRTALTHMGWRVSVPRKQITAAFPGITIFNKLVESTGISGVPENIDLVEKGFKIRNPQLSHADARTLATLGWVLGASLKRENGPDGSIRITIGASNKK